MWILLSRFPPKTSSRNALPGVSLPPGSNWVTTTPSWKCTHMPLLCSPAAWGHPASQRRQVCLRLQLLPLGRPRTPEESIGLPLPGFPTQETFCFSNLLLEWWFINVQHSPDTNREEESGKDRRGGRRYQSEPRYLAENMVWRPVLSLMASLR